MNAPRILVLTRSSEDDFGNASALASPLGHVGCNLSTLDPTMGSRTVILNTLLTSLVEIPLRFQDRSEDVNEANAEQVQRATTLAEEAYMEAVVGWSACTVLIRLCQQRHHEQSLLASCVHTGQRNNNASVGVEALGPCRIRAMLALKPRHHGHFGWREAPK